MPPIPNGLRLSENRKTSTVLSRAGDRSALANAFNLPAGLPTDGGTCRGATTGPGGCHGPCYAVAQARHRLDLAKMERANLALLQEARTVAKMHALLLAMVDAFTAQADRIESRTGRPVARFVRIHGSGDYFSRDYCRAWARTITARPDIRFWCYTRDEWSMRYLMGLDLSNLSLYWSGDIVNAPTARELQAVGAKVAWLASTFDQARALSDVEPGAVRAITCPEPTRIPLPGACNACRVCIVGRRPVLFSTTDK